MQFKPHTFSHNERPDWYLHTHLRLTGRSGDTQDGIDMVKHIASVAQKKNRSVLSVIEVMRDFPARQPHRGFPDAILSDLRALANSRDSGTNCENKDLLELGSMVCDHDSHD